METSDASLEPGWEKVALYADQDGPTHAARQLANGRWTGQLGSWEDINHESSEDLSGPLYGNVLLFLRRPQP